MTWYDRCQTLFKEETTSPLSDFNIFTNQSTFSPIFEIPDGEIKMSNNHSGLVEILNGQMTSRTSPQTEDIRREEEWVSASERATSDHLRIRLAFRHSESMNYLNCGLCVVWSVSRGKPRKRLTLQTRLRVVYILNGRATLFVETW